MRHILPMLSVIAVLGLTAADVFAGGSATVHIDRVPKSVIAGQAFEIGFSMKPMWSGRRSTEPVVRAECGGESFTVAATPLKTQDRYTASVTLPKAGEWTITVDSRYCQTVMTPLTLKVDAPKNRQS